MNRRSRGEVCGKECYAGWYGRKKWEWDWRFESSLEESMQEIEILLENILDLFIFDVKVYELVEYLPKIITQTKILHSIFRGGPNRIFSIFLAWPGFFRSWGIFACDKLWKPRKKSGCFSWEAKRTFILIKHSFFRLCCL